MRGGAQEVGGRGKEQGTRWIPWERQGNLKMGPYLRKPLNSLIHLFSKYLLSNYYVLGNNSDNFLCHGAQYLRRRYANKFKKSLGYAGGRVKHVGVVGMSKTWGRRFLELTLRKHSAL